MKNSPDKPDRPAPPAGRFPATRPATAALPRLAPKWPASPEHPAAFRTRSPSRSGSGRWPGSSGLYVHSRSAATGCQPAHEGREKGPASRAVKPMADAVRTRFGRREPFTLRRAARRHAARGSAGDGKAAVVPNVNPAKPANWTRKPRFDAGTGGDYPTGGVRAPNRRFRHVRRAAAGPSRAGRAVQGERQPGTTPAARSGQLKTRPAREARPDGSTFGSSRGAKPFRKVHEHLGNDGAKRSIGKGPVVNQMGRRILL